MRGSWTSAPYTALPVTLSTPSGRNGRVPITRYLVSAAISYPLPIVHSLISQFHFPNSISRIPFPRFRIFPFPHFPISAFLHFRIPLLLPPVRCRLLHGPHDLVVARAAAEVPGEPPTDLAFRRI